MQSGGRMEEDRKIGKYRILGTLGQGGEGCVYLAEDEGLRRRAAVKRLWEKESRSSEEITREAALLRDLSHPMLPVVYELLYEDGWYLVMEYVKGISLHKYIETQGRVQEEQARLWGTELLEVLGYLHMRNTPVIYRDLKPDNIMLCRDGNLKLVDFGAAVLRSFGERQGGGMAYTEGYAAPEQRGKVPHADERSDIYAFGKLLYYLVTGANPGTAPYTALPVSLYNPLLSVGLETVIRRCTEEEPEARYQVVGEVMADLKRSDFGKRGGRKGGFVRRVEKQVYLTRKEGRGLLPGADLRIV